MVSGKCGKWEKWTIPKWGIDVGQALGYNNITITLDDDTFWACNFNQRQFKMRFDNDNDYDNLEQLTMCREQLQYVLSQCVYAVWATYRLHVNFQFDK